MKAILERELAAYAANRHSLLREHAGRVVLVKDDKIVDVFESESFAYSHGLSLFGNVPFLVKRIAAIEPVSTIVTITG